MNLHKEKALIFVISCGNSVRRGDSGEKGTVSSNPNRISLIYYNFKF